MIISPASFHPRIEKKLGINMEIFSSGNTGSHNINHRTIVFTNWIRRFLGKPDFLKHIYQLPRSLGISYIKNNLFFRVTQRIYWLSFIPINNSTSVKFKIKSSSGYPLGRFISVCSIHKTHQLSLISVLLVFGGIFVTYLWMVFGFWNISSRGTLILCLTPQYLVIRRYIASFFSKLLW